MQVSARLAIAASMALSLSALTASAAEPRNQAEVDALLQSSFTNINGRETPELIPYHVRMGAFFARFASYAPELQGQLSKADFDRLQQFAGSHETFRKQALDAELGAWQTIAARAEPMSAVEIATEMKQSETRSAAAATARYRGVLDGLTAEGRSIVDRFAFERVRPSLAIEDPLLVATTAPVFYKTQVLGVYKLMQAGKWPPAPPAAATKQAETTLSGDGARVGSN